MTMKDDSDVEIAPHVEAHLNRLPVIQVNPVPIRVLQVAVNKKKNKDKEKKPDDAEQPAATIMFALRVLGGPEVEKLCFVAKDFIELVCSTKKLEENLNKYIPLARAAARVATTKGNPMENLEVAAVFTLPEAQLILRNHPCSRTRSIAKWLYRQLEYMCPGTTRKYGLDNTPEMKDGKRSKATRMENNAKLQAQAAVHVHALKQMHQFHNFAQKPPFGSSQSPFFPQQTMNPLQYGMPASSPYLNFGFGPHAFNAGQSSLSSMTGGIRGYGLPHGMGMPGSFGMSGVPAGIQTSNSQSSISPAQSQNFQQFPYFAESSKSDSPFVNNEYETSKSMSSTNTNLSNSLEDEEFKGVNEHLENLLLFGLESRTEAPGREAAYTEQKAQEYLDKTSLESKQKLRGVLTKLLEEDAALSKKQNVTGDSIPKDPSLVSMMQSNFMGIQPGLVGMHQMGMGTAVPSPMISPNMMQSNMFQQNWMGMPNSMHQGMYGMPMNTHSMLNWGAGMH